MELWAIVNNRTQDIDVAVQRMELDTLGGWAIIVHGTG